MTVSLYKRRRRLGLGAAGLAVVLLVAGVALGRGLPPGVALAAAGETGSDGQGGGTISVTGQARVKAVPDTATITLGVQSQAAGAAEAMDKTSAAMNRVIAAVISAGVPRANIQTTNISLYPQYEYDKNGSNGRIVGYQASNQISCTWNKLDKIGDLIDAAVQAGANNVYGISFNVADSKPLYLEAVAEAVRDARAKADALAAAAGVRVGGVKNMNLDSYFSGPFLLKSEAAGAGMAAPVEPGTVEVQVTVRVEYGIE